MTVRERMERIFAGERVDRVPFALKGWRIGPSATERRLRNEGLHILDARPVYSVASPNVSTQTHGYAQEGVWHQRTTLRTPRGELSQVTRQSGGTTWRVERLFKGPQDYAALRSMVADRRYAPAYEGYLQAEADMGEDAYFKTNAPGCPLHEVMYEMMGLEAFAVEWAERRDEVLALTEAIAANDRDALAITARSPARLVQCGGNYSPEVLGRERFVAHVVPHWEEAGALLHEGGKLLGCHLDADNRLWADLVHQSPLDWIEAFTPAPDTDMTLAEARQAWPGKVQFINFPSSVHLASAEVIAATTRQLLREAAPGDGLIIGITENVPEHRWRESYSTILATVNQYGRLPIDPDAC